MRTELHTGYGPVVVTVPSSYELVHPELKVIAIGAKTESKSLLSSGIGANFGAGLHMFRKLAAQWLVLICIIDVLKWESLWNAMDGEHWYHFFCFLTNWTAMITTAYFVLVAYGSKFSGHRTSTLYRRAAVLWQTATVFSLLATMVFWAAIFKPERYSQRADGRSTLCMFLSMNTHGGSLLLLGLDRGLALGAASSVPVLARDSSLGCLGFGCTYYTFHAVLHAVEGRWLYPFLAPSWPLLNAAVCCILFLCYSVVSAFERATRSQQASHATGSMKMQHV